MKQNISLQELVSLAKRRGFVYASSEIYGGFSAVYDYGPLGAELVKNIKSVWWRNMVQMREDIVGLDSSIVMNPKIWEASGHVSGFSDPLAECKSCHTRLRVDHLLEEINVTADEKMSEEEINRIFNAHRAEIKCPNCGKSDFTSARKFNLLVKTNLGNFTSDLNQDPVYLRGETCQGIYVNYQNVISSSRVKIPFGIAQIGKAFRNEITARQFIFRTREFEQMEMQYFTHPSQEMVEYEKLREYRWQFYLDLGITAENLRWKKHKNLVFYAREAYDIEFKYPFGFAELEGIHARGDYDLSQHSKFSSKDLSYLNQQTGEKFMPHIIEASSGVGRLFLAILTQAYQAEEVNGKQRNILKLPFNLSPYKIAVFPLVKNKPEIVTKAKQIFNRLKLKWMVDWDDRGNIGKRYFSQDEVGTPFCVTVDYDTLEKDVVTVRERDSMQQHRVKVGNLLIFLQEKLEN